MTWFYLALLSAILFATGALLARLLIVKSEDPRAFSFLYNLSGAFLSILFFFIFFTQPWHFNIPSKEIIFLTILAALLYGIFERTNFYARKNLEASVFIILFELSPVITFIAAILFLGENLTLLKVFAAIMIVLGNILIVYKNNIIKFDKGLLIAFITVLSFGLVRILDKAVSVHYPLPVYMFIIWSIPTIFVFLPNIPLKKIKKEAELASWKIILLSIFNVSGFYVLIKALQLADASKVTLISSTNSIMVVLAGIILLNEKSHLVKKIIAAVMVFVGVLLLR